MATKSGKHYAAGKRVWQRPLLKKILKQVFGHTGFRPFQQEAVEAVMANRDLLMILPTGGGKSLCYQLPALMKEGVTVVVSPLLALMHDQVRALKLQGVEAEMIGSMQTPEEIGTVIAKLREGEVKLLYIAPERFFAPGFLKLLKSIQIAMFVIDEAHCVSEWGHEFREDYRRLGVLKEYFPNTPVAAFTATATPEVESDILLQLGLNEPVRLRGSVYRNNLLIRAEPRRGDGRGQLVDFLRRYRGESGIVYTFTRNAAEKLADYLNRQGFRAKAYHAGLTKRLRREAYHAFVHDEIDVVVATVAFGMGIDKSNIRYVVHTRMPKTLENYYQEIGRAGRDGLPAETLLLYSAADAAQRASLLEELPEGPYRQNAYNKLEKMIGFCRSESCRHGQIADYFAERMEACGERCDNCMGDAEHIDVTEDARKFLSALYRTRQRFGKSHLIDLLRGAENRKIMQFGHEKLSVYGIGKERSRGEWEAIVERLMELGALARGQHRSLLLTPVGAEILKGKGRVKIRSDRLRVKERKRKPPRSVPADIVYDKAIFDRLRALRKEIAAKEGVPAYIVFADRTLALMAALLPVTRNEMLGINGVGEVKFERYGEEFLTLLKELSNGEL
ncbi:DNA helicase RecQ [Hydrogenimonas urashimensis]|uniref:DNA helicase RecQ n=1 Tax=Hydrogenimonas urashimensis TaxID=2740515 RepID=UPI001915F688|nr:DNA helicase RecQ [Hydrogenimonas urashimensis]